MPYKITKQARKDGAKQDLYDHYDLYHLFLFFTITAGTS
jgi:hypothetical protein